MTRRRRGDAGDLVDGDKVADVCHEWELGEKVAVLGTRRASELGAGPGSGVLLNAAVRPRLPARRGLAADPNEAQWALVAVMVPNC